MKHRHWWRAGRRIQASTALWEPLPATPPSPSPSLPLYCFPPILSLFGLFKGGEFPPSVQSVRSFLPLWSFEGLYSPLVATANVSAIFLSFPLSFSLLPLSLALFLSRFSLFRVSYSFDHPRASTALRWPPRVSSLSPYPCLPLRPLSPLSFFLSSVLLLPLAFFIVRSGLGTEWYRGVLNCTASRPAWVLISAWQTVENTLFSDFFDVFCLHLKRCQAAEFSISLITELRVFRRMRWCLSPV